MKGIRIHPSYELRDELDSITVQLDRASVEAKTLFPAYTIGLISLLDFSYFFALK